MSPLASAAAMVMLMHCKNEPVHHPLHSMATLLFFSPFWFANSISAHYFSTALQQHFLQTCYCPLCLRHLPSNILRMNMSTAPPMGGPGENTVVWLFRVMFKAEDTSALYA